MASTLAVFFLLFIPFAAVESQKIPSHSISLGSSLSPSIPPSSWCSPSLHFAFGFYSERNGFAVGIWLVGKPNDTVVWTANRDHPLVSSNSTLEFTPDGRLILHTDQGIEQSIADTNGELAVSAAMLDSGNFVLYDNSSSSIWESFSFPTDTILRGQTLASDSLVSSVSSSDHSSGHFLIYMRRNGKLVAYPSATSNVLTLVNGSHLAENNTIIYRATLDDDGIFRLYSHSFEGNRSPRALKKWSLLQDHCQVHGFCGFNSYCSRNGTEADCYCYPGFVFVDNSNKFLGCYRNFREDPCRSENGWVMSYNMTTLENVIWGDYSYFVASMEKEDCRKSCAQDCNCAAALFLNGICRKHKLPLRYGTRNLSKLNTAFVKIGIQDHILNSPLGPSVVTDNKRGLISILALSLGSIACFCFVIAISSFFIYKRRVHRYKKLSDNAKLVRTEEFTLRSFSYDELEKATEGFKEELGKGSYGTVYRGTLSGVNKVDAVKRLENVLEEGEREFQCEVTAIGRTHHRNLVRLLVFCVEGSRKLLVYEYMSNGSLADLLFKAESHPSWRERVRIALDIARGILYLHEECEACIVHCDIKPQNILMDDSWTGKISDFGFAKLLPPNHIRSITGAGGTGSYLAPEWQKHALMSVKADNYSFGVVLLEVICCRRNIVVNVSNADEIILSSWVYNCLDAGELYKLVGDENVDSRTLQRMVKVGLWCIQDDPALRPSMKKVILMLEGTVDIPVPPNPSPFLLHS
ncbi:receptor-like protein kinase 1 [Actinidia rufa]|uniref:Receptor-like serine/threonine-protein kinase n=1 Tax=Actinidia rufa TaxID=165716 RepID=A0A7J0EZY9_9ERIC|nr:receptor-like protein kinase 1 [Actinidia rufa]